MRILIIDGDSSRGQTLGQLLDFAGMWTRVVMNGLRGRELALSEDFGLVILDAEAPGIGSEDLLEQLRRSCDSPVLVLSRNGAIDLTVGLLEAGADDVLVQPYEEAELLARIQALARRSLRGRPAKLEHISIADLELDVIHHSARRGGRTLDLSVREFTLLKVLVALRGRVVSRARLIDLVWGSNFDRDSNVVDVAVQRLRRKLDQSQGTKLLHTVRGMGYVVESRSSPGAESTERPLR